MVGFCLFLVFVLMFVFLLFLVDFLYFLSLLCPFLATMSFADYFLVRFFCLLSLLPRTCFRFDLFWFRLSCDYDWIRSGSVNVRYTRTPAGSCKD